MTGSSIGRCTFLLKTAMRVCVKMGYTGTTGILPKWQFQWKMMINRINHKIPGYPIFRQNPYVENTQNKQQTTSSWEMWSFSRVDEAVYLDLHPTSWPYSTAIQLSHISEFPNYKGAFLHTSGPSTAKHWGVFYVNSEDGSSTWDNPLTNCLRPVIDIGRGYLQALVSDEKVWCDMWCMWCM